MAGQPGFFGIDERLRERSSKGDGLERLKRLVDFGLFWCRPRGGCSSRGSM